MRNLHKVALTVATFFVGMNAAMAASPVGQWNVTFFFKPGLIQVPPRASASSRTGAGSRPRSPAGRVAGSRRATGSAGTARPAALSPPRSARSTATGRSAAASMPAYSPSTASRAAVAIGTPPSWAAAVARALQRPGTRLDPATPPSRRSPDGPRPVAGARCRAPLRQARCAGLQAAPTRRRGGRGPPGRVRHAGFPVPGIPRPEASPRTRILTPASTASHKVPMIVHALVPVVSVEQRPHWELNLVQYRDINFFRPADQIEVLPFPIDRVRGFSTSLTRSPS